MPNPLKRVDGGLVVAGVVPAAPATFVVFAVAPNKPPPVAGFVPPPNEPAPVAPLIPPPNEFPCVPDALFAAKLPKIPPVVGVFEGFCVLAVFPKAPTVGAAAGVVDEAEGLLDPNAAPPNKLFVAPPGFDPHIPPGCCCAA